MPFKISLTDAQREDIFKMFEDDLQENISDRADYDNRRIQLYNAYRNRVRPKNFPWSGCSNTSVPLITRSVDRMVVHVMQTIAPQGVFSSMTALPVSNAPLADDRARDVTDYMEYNFRNKMKITDPLERFVRNFCLFGNAFGKIWWKRVLRNTRNIERYPAFEDVQDDDGEMKKRQVSVKESVIEHFSTFQVEKFSRSSGEYEAWDIEIFDPIEKREKEFHVEGYYDEDHRENVLLFVSKELVINQPQFDSIDLDDIYFPLKATSLDDCHHVAIRYEKPFSEIMAGYTSGRWNLLTKEDIDEMEEISKQDGLPGEQPIEMTPRTPIDAEQILQRRQDAVEGGETNRTYPFEVWEEFRKFDIDGDGELEEVVIWYEKRTKKVMRIEHLFVDYHMHERPIIHGSFVPVGNRLLGIGVGEILFPIQVELNSVFNHRNDATTMSISPGGFYRPGSGMDPGEFKWQPNTFAPLDNPGSDFAPYVPVSSTRDAINVENFLLAFAEDLSISTFTMGRGSDRPNAPRTARGTLALLQQDAIKLDYINSRITPVLTEICKKVLNVLRVNAPETEEFRSIGTNALKTVRKEDLHHNYDFYWELDSVSSNKEIRRQYAATALEAILPLAQMPPEALAPGARLLGRRFLEFLDFKNPEEILPAPPGFDRLPINQEDEIIAMIQGINIVPIMADDHMQHIQIMDAFEVSDEFGMVTSEWVKNVWKPHKEAHLRFLRIQQQQIQAMGGGGRTQGRGNFGNFVGQQGLMSGDVGGIGLSETAAEEIGSTFTGSM